MATGLQDEIEKISYVSLNFKMGNFKELILLFAPGEIDHLDQIMTDLEDNSHISPKSSVRIADMAIFDEFADRLRKIKKVENIKSSAIAINRMVEIVSEYLDGIEKEEAAKVSEKEAADKKAKASKKAKGDKAGKTGKGKTKKVSKTDSPKS
jgi:hypothetical protein